MRRIARNRTTLTIAHRLSTIVDADEILVLDAGGSSSAARMRALLAANGVYARMWQLQQTRSGRAPGGDAESVNCDADGVDTGSGVPLVDSPDAITPVSRTRRSRL